MKTLSPFVVSALSQTFPLFRRNPAASLSIVLVLAGSLSALPSKPKVVAQYGAGLIINVPFPENEVTQVVQDVVQNGIIRGTREYEKDEYVKGATAATSSRLFPEWTGGGKTFYKVRLKALDPRNFKDSNDIGTLAVRYIVQAQGDKNTVLRIDAVFVEDFRHAVHASDGSVEGAEYKDIHDHLDAITELKAQTAEAERAKQAHLAAKDGVSSREKDQSPALTDESSSSVPRPAVSAPPPVVEKQPDPPPVEVSASEVAPAPAVPQTLEQRAAELRRQVERVVKAPGAPLKSAPFHTASTLQSLPTGAEVLVVISTPYWLGVETHDGQHGWIYRDELELLP